IEWCRTGATCDGKGLRGDVSGADLRCWQDNPKLLKKRQAVLEKLEEQLQSPPPPEKRIPKRFRSHCEWEIGEVIAYRLRSGKWALFRVIKYNIDKGGTSPICELLDWVGDEIPPREELAKLPIRRRGPWNRFHVGGTSERELPQDRVRRLGIKLELSQEKPPCGIPVYLWRSMDF